MYFKKRFVSPLIATILLIVVSVILITVILTWGKGFTESTIDNTDLFTAFTEDVDLKNFILVDSFIQTPTNNNLVLKNSSDKNINIVGYSLHSVDSNYVFLEKRFYLEETLNLTSGSFNSLPIVCAPSSRFSIQLITDQNTFVEIPIFTNNLDPNNYCLGVSNVVFRETFSSEEETIALGGIPTNVVYSNGFGSFNGSNSRINYGNRFNFEDHFFSIRIITNASADNIGRYTGVLSKDAGPSGERSFLLQTKDSSGYFTFDVWQTNNSRISANSGVVVDNNIHDIFCVADGSKISIFIDGVLKNQVSYDGTIHKSSVSFFIGKYGSSSYYKGTIDLVEIYNTPLTAEEVSFLYRYN